MTNLSLERYLIQLAVKLCGDRKTLSLQHTEDIQPDDLIEALLDTKIPVARFYQPFCLENLTKIDLLCLLLPYSDVLQQHLSRLPNCKIDSLSAELLIIEKATEACTKSIKNFAKLYESCAQLGNVLTKLLICNLQLQSIPNNLLKRITDCFAQHLQLKTKYCGDPYQSLFVFNPLIDQFINLILVNNMCCPLRIKDQLISQQILLSTNKRQLPSFFHTRHAMPIAEKLRCMRLSDLQRKIYPPSDEIPLGKNLII